MVFLREHPEQTALVHIARAGHDGMTVPRATLRGVEESHTAYGSVPISRDDPVTLRTDGPCVGIWTWPTPPDERPDGV